ncbi:MAG: beta-ketoacyl-[acyl-carrier-protein] synthase family protein [Acidobacteriota bacterium]
MTSVAVTGLGVVSPIGAGPESFWAALCEGRSGVSDVRAFPTAGMRCPRAAECPPAEPCENRVAALGFEAARQAVASAGLDSMPDGAALIMGTSVGGLPESEEAYLRALKKGRRLGGIRPYLNHCPSASTDLIAHKLHQNGPRITVANACSSGTAALGEAWLMVGTGEVDCALAGAADALARLTVGGFNCLRVVTSDVPRPFDKDREGMAVGEGAAFLVLENMERARRRGADILATLEGYGVSSDAYHATAPDPTGGGPLRCMRQAMEAAGIDVDSLGYINAHGTGTRANDDAEGRALAALLGERAGAIPVVSIKGALGHALGAAGGFEAAACVLALRRQTVPPCTGHRMKEPDLPLFVPTRPLRRSINYVLSINLAFGGNNAALVWRRAP